MNRFDLNLEKFGVNVEELKKKPTKIFRAWVEDDEKKLIRTRGAAVEAKLLTKYSGMVLYDPDTKKTCTIHSGNLEWHTRGKEATYTGWYLVGVTADDDAQAWEICDAVCDIIADTPQADDVQVIRRDEGGNDEEADDEEVVAQVGV